MNTKWNDEQPIYRQLRDRVVAMILEHAVAEGDALPSARTVAAEYKINHLTVLKAYQELSDEGLVENRRGVGLFVTPGARERLLRAERKVGSEPNGGLFVLPDSHNVVHRKRIIELAAEYRLPAIYYFRFLRPTVASSLMAPTKWISSFAAKSAMR